MKKMAVFFLCGVCAALLSFGFNHFFMRLSERSDLDQALLLFFLSCSLTFILFSIWSDGIKAGSLQLPDVPALRGKIRDNAAGLALSLFFFLIYLYLGSRFGEFTFSHTDNLFDADISSWTRRIADPGVKTFEMRGPHPFAYFILRPFGRALNLITGTPSLSALLLNAFAGGAGVFLAWLFIKRQFQNRMYAFLVAALLGTSASHAFFGAVVDTYIFSALALILFVYLIQPGGQSMVAPVMAGVLTFGITLTNFVQNFIAFVVVRPRLREIIRFAGWVVSISILLTYLHAAVYPSSKLFFLTPDIQNERKFFANILKSPDWRIAGRSVLMARTVLLYTVISPKPFALLEEVGSATPEFRFFKITPGTFHQSGYDGVGQFLVGVWMLMLVVAGLVFAWNLVRTRKADLSLSFVLCIAFNFGLHVFYGEEPFLYSSGWAYALIFFVAFGLAPFSRNRFFQAALALFLILLAYHQWQFFMSIFEVLDSYLIKGIE
ncbi:MAG: hypothetical protein Q8L87_11425 [Anaerolineales bacterium]|nr:hypothetical protein [Anaerolineales bacterium]